MLNNAARTVFIALVSTVMGVTLTALATTATPAFASVPLTQAAAPACADAPLARVHWISVA